VLGDSAEHCEAGGYDHVLVAHHANHVPPARVTAVRSGGQVLLGLRGGLGAGHHALLHHQINTATGASELTGALLDRTATLLAQPGRAVPAQLGWAHSVPSGTRVWLLIPACVAAGLLVAGLELLARHRTPSRAIAVHAWGAAVALASMTGAVLVAGAPGFVLFVVPLFAVLLVWQGVTAAGLRVRAAPVWLVTLVGAMLLGWPLALTFPVTA